MKSNLDDYRASAAEQERIADLLRLLPLRGASVLDVGARDGYVSKRLADRFEQVIALDLQLPVIDDPRVRCVKGDITELEMEDGEFECVVCAEVLEHVPAAHLRKAAAELSRVAEGAVVIGVPYRQDLRLGRTTCSACGGDNPPWGHVNTFDENALQALFPDRRAGEWSYVGRTNERTNAISAALMQVADNPYGTYSQEEACIHCGRALQAPQSQTLMQRASSALASRLTRVQQRIRSGRPKWVHVRLERA